ncbi:hypothetical protein L208DRAFT_1396672 [Tricholoma matsutake]|nr:hypothetical protein L208DRAFT_1396672 [Tricholoma matsutake 945]
MTVNILLVLLSLFSSHCGLCLLMQYLGVLAAIRALDNNEITEYAYKLISDEKLPSRDFLRSCNTIGLDSGRREDIRLPEEVYCSELEKKSS